MLTRRSPIFDIEHLQLFSRPALRRLFEHAGFERIEMHPILNRYPLRVWLRYVALPPGLKRTVLDALQGRMGALAIAVPVGNVAVIGYRARPVAVAGSAPSATEISTTM